MHRDNKYNMASGTALIRKILLDLKNNNRVIEVRAHSNIENGFANNYIPINVINNEGQLQQRCENLNKKVGQLEREIKELRAVKPENQKITEETVAIGNHVQSLFSNNKIESPNADRIAELNNIIIKKDNEILKLGNDLDALVENLEGIDRNYTISIQNMENEIERLKEKLESKKKETVNLQENAEKIYGNFFSEQLRAERERVKLLTGQIENISKENIATMYELEKLNARPVFQEKIIYLEDISKANAINEKQVEINRLKKELEEARLVMRTGKGGNNEFEDKYNKLKIEIANMKIQSENTDIDIAKNYYSMQIEEKNTEIKNLEKKMANYESENKKAVIILETEINKYKEKISKLENELIQSNADQNEAKTAIANLRNAYETKIKNVTEGYEKKVLPSLVADLKSNFIQSFNEQIGTNLEDFSSCVDYIYKLKTSSENFKLFEKELDGYKKTTDKQNGEILRLQNEMEGIENEKKTLEKKNLDLQKQIKDNETEIKNLKMANESKNVYEETNKAELERIHKANADLVKTNEDLQYINKQLLKQSEDLNETMMVVKTQNENLKLEVSQIATTMQLKVDEKNNVYLY